MDPHTQKIRKIIINTAENMAIKVNNKIRTTIVGGVCQFSNSGDRLPGNVKIFHILIIILGVLLLGFLIYSLGPLLIWRELMLLG